MESRPGAQVAHADVPMLSWALHSDVGAVREGNEDSVGAYAPELPEERGPLFVVADGMGGHLAGEVASRIAVETMFGEWLGGAAGFPKQALRAAVVAANAAVFAASLDVEHHGMGTTLVALAFTGVEAVVAHVGDSRAYLVRGGEAAPLTRDHSRVNEMMRMRLITAEQAEHHPARSTLTRSLGQAPAVQVEIGRTEVRAGDAFLLCSDGLWDMVTREEIAQAAGSKKAPAEAAATLVATALERGAPDNVTCVVVRVHEVVASEEPDARPWWAFLRGGR